MRLLVLPALLLVASCSWMPSIYGKKEEAVVVPLVPAPDPGLAPAPAIDQAQQVVSPQYQQQFAPDPMAVNQQQYQLQVQQQQQMMMQAQPQQVPAAAPAQPQYYYAVPAQQPYYQGQPAQPQYYMPVAPAAAPQPQAAPMLGQPMPHTFTTGAQYLENDVQALPGEDDFPAEYTHVKPPGESKAQYIKRDDLEGQQIQVQPTAPPLMGQPQQPVLQGR